MRYTEAVVTLDADILVAVAEPDKLDVLSPIYAFCRKRCFLPEGEAIRVGDWPVQLIPAFSKLTREAIRDAETGDLDGIIQAILKKQATWQRSRAERPWAQKLRDSVVMRRALISLKKHPTPLTEMRPNQD